MSTEAVAHPDDLQANDLGGWVNNAIQKSYYSVKWGLWRDGRSISLDYYRHVSRKRREQEMM